MQIPHQTYKIDLNNINEPLTRIIESVNDKFIGRCLTSIISINGKIEIK